jgi:hypothetical protein
MGKRRCDVTLVAPNGQRHTITVEANSVFHAALLFYGESNAGGSTTLPRCDVDTILEVSPSYKVRVRDAMAWANIEANKQNRAP